MLILTVLQGPDKGKTFQLPDHEPQLVGRSSEALPLKDATVSRRHAELTPDDGEWWIRDLNSQNGTYVNGVKIAERTRLRVGDQIRTGATLFVFGRTDADDPGPLRVVRPRDMETSFERTLVSNEDSMVLAEPEPRSAAVHHLQVIYRITALTSRLTDREELLKGVMDLVFSEFKPERGFIILADAGDPAPKPAVVKYATPPRDKDEAKIHVSKTILNHVLKKGEGVLSSNAMTDPRFKSGDSVQQFAIHSAICCPIKFVEKTFGVLYIDSTVANYTFTPEQLALLNAIGRHAGLALANAEAYAAKLRSERLAAIGETVASLSHSIKNILQGLRGGADVVEMGLKKDDLKIAKGGWTILKRNLDRIIGLSLNMLAYSRQRTLEFELTKIGPLVEDCAQLLQDLCRTREVALLIDVDPETPPVPMDPNMMHQALMNLLGNAVEAVDPKRGAVTVRAAYHPASPNPPAATTGPSPKNHRTHSRAELRIVVIDNGPGIPRDKHARVFEPFFTTKGLRGTGLGLAVAKRIIEEHNGRIELQSDSAGARTGATFTIILPADQPGLIDPSATAHSRHHAEGA
jgi:signal transduction histidine kinase/pSer/pThr/pTyr-binding forkhead associated (FHA) protein